MVDDYRPRFDVPNPDKRATDWQDDYWYFTLVADEYLLDHGDSAERPAVGEYHGEVYADIEGDTIEYWDMDAGNWVTIGNQYTDSDAVDAVNAETSLDVDITGDAQSVDSYAGNVLGVLFEDETVTGSWQFDERITFTGNQHIYVPDAAEDSIVAAEIAAGNPQFTHVFQVSDDGEVTRWYYDRRSNDLVFGISHAGTYRLFGIEPDGSIRVRGTTVYDATNGQVPLTVLEADTVTVAGNAVTLGGSVAVAHADLSAIGANDHHTEPSAGSGITDESDNEFGLTENAVTVAGNLVALGGSTGIDHIDLAGIGPDDHHTDPSAGSGITDEADNQFGLVNDAVTVAGNVVALGGSTSVDHADLSAIGPDDHHTEPSAGSGVTDEGDNQFGLDSVANGTATLSGGVAVVDTGHPTDTTAEYNLLVNPDGCDVAASLDSTGTTYEIHFEENTSSVGNPDVRWRLVRYS